MSAKGLIWILAVFGIGFALLGLGMCGYKKIQSKSNSAPEKIEARINENS